MRIKIDYTISAQDNADQYFRLSKKLKRKAEGASAAIMDLEGKKSRAVARPSERKVSIRKITERKWYEKFNWFNSSNGMLAIGGRSALQNELINSRYFDSNDLFFHADVFGASVVVLKYGTKATREIREEAAQFAACYSKAWEGGSSSVNVYALRREQVSKSKEKGSLGTGSFLLEGEREWFKGVALELCAFSSESGIPAVVPVSTCMSLGIRRYLLIKPGNTKKSDAAKLIASRLKFSDIDYVMQHLPPGGFSIKET
jgi:predicted ribosome quality control (RQC) complex YloA/Tae2 family protein